MRPRCRKVRAQQSRKGIRGSNSPTVHQRFPVGDVSLKSRSLIIKSNRSRGARPHSRWTYGVTICKLIAESGYSHDWRHPTPLPCPTPHPQKPHSPPPTPPRPNPPYPFTPTPPPPPPNPHPTSRIHPQSTPTHPPPPHPNPQPSPAHTPRQMAMPPKQPLTLPPVHCPKQQ